MRIALLERVASTTWSRQDDADADDDDDGVYPLVKILSDDDCD